MSLYEDWIRSSYDRNGKSIKKLWEVYMPLEQVVYENMIGSKNPEIKGTVAELAERYSMPQTFICGFLDGIKEAIDNAPDVENLEPDTLVDAKVDFEQLFRKMVEYKAEHLYTLPQWDDHFTEEQRKAFYTETKTAKTFVREGEKVGRNDPCPCGSGKKYKKCCGLEA